MDKAILISLDAYNAVHKELVDAQRELQMFRNRQQYLKELVTSEVERNINKDEEYFFEGAICVKDLYPLLDASVSFDEFHNMNWDLHKAHLEKINEKA